MPAARRSRSPPTSSISPFPATYTKSALDDPVCFPGRYYNVPAQSPEPMWSDSPFCGYVESTEDALLILEASRRGLIPMVTRRFATLERKLIQSGSVFVFEERESGIKRWTDGRRCSSSRTLGNFLVYHEIERRTPTNLGAAGALNGSKTSLQLRNDRYKPKEDGMTKKAFSITLPSSNKIYHLVSYYKAADIEAGHLRTPCSFPALQALDINPELLEKTRFRAPLRVEVGQDGRTRLRSESLGERPNSKLVLSDNDLHLLDFPNVPPFTGGGSCELHIAIYRPSKVKLAMKRPRLDYPTEEVIKRFRREAAIWSAFDHDNILPFVGIIQKEHRLYIVSLWMPLGDLLSFVQTRNALLQEGKLGEGISVESESLIYSRFNERNTIREIATGLEYLHANGVVHGDMKAKNVLLDDKGRAQICDFGLTKTLDHTVTSTELKGVGSIRWQSPELMINAAKSPESDIYAFGMTIAEVLTANYPFPHLKTAAAVTVAIVIHNERPLPHPESQLGVDFRPLWNLAARCWQTVVEDRPVIQEVLQQLMLMGPNQTIHHTNDPPSTNFPSSQQDAVSLASKDTWSGCITWEAPDTSPPSHRIWATAKCLQPSGSPQSLPWPINLTINHSQLRTYDPQVLAHTLLSNRLAVWEFSNWPTMNDQAQSGMDFSLLVAHLSSQKVGAAISFPEIDSPPGTGMFLYASPGQLLAAMFPTTSIPFLDTPGDDIGPLHSTTIIHV